jgi:hypothetical protein
MMCVAACVFGLILGQVRLLHLPLLTCFLHTALQPLTLFDFCLQLQEIFAVANMRDRGLEDLMETVLTFLGENK